MEYKNLLLHSAVASYCTPKRTPHITCLEIAPSLCSSQWQRGWCQNLYAGSSTKTLAHRM